MKPRVFILTAALLGATSLAGDLLAQTNLIALMKRCETMEKIDVDVVSNKDRKTRRPVKEVITISFSKKDHPKLLDEFIDAFRKDKEAAYKVMESKVNGKVIPSYYRFAVGTSDISFSLDGANEEPEGNGGIILRNGKAGNGVIQVTKIERFDFKEEEEWG